MPYALFALVLALTVALTNSSARPIATSASMYELTDRADVIVIGRASARQTSWVGRDLVTFVSIEVTESLKGGATTRVTVAVPGGVDRRRKVPVEIVYVGAPQIASGEEALLFLDDRGPTLDGAFVVAGAADGKVSVITDRTGEKRVGRQRAPLSQVRETINRRLRRSLF